jgi:molybdopterin-synthase adenylyltransferase
MDDQQLLRYSRHILLPQVDALGQQRLLDSTALIIGLGGLGSPLAMYLASSGVGHLMLADGDAVELSNLQRQILHTTADIGRPKVASARDNLLKLNPQIRITSLPQRLDETNLLEYIAQADVVIDGSDNFATRFAINRACVKARKPLVSGAAIRFEGQVSVFDSRRDDSPCYHCLYKEVDEEELRCAENGILAPVVGMIGTIQAIEALKLLLNIGETLAGRLVIVDALTMEIRTLSLRKDPHCAVCAAPLILKGK